MSYSAKGAWELNFEASKRTALGERRPLLPPPYSQKLKVAVLKDGTTTACGLFHTEVNGGPAETHSCLLGAKGVEVILNVLIQVYPTSWKPLFGKVPPLRDDHDGRGDVNGAKWHSTKDEFHVNWIYEGSGARSKEHYLARAGLASAVRGFFAERWYAVLSMFVL